MNFELYFSKILFSLYTEIKYEISLFYLKNFFTFVRKLNFYLDSLYDRNLLGGLYRENPVKSRNYEAVKSSKKWENVGNSYIIPALLLYRYSYI